nr:MAG TPA: hypothetical protein [Caudoviricetes sp.]
MFRKNRYKIFEKNEMYRFFRNMKCVYMEKHYNMLVKRS